VAGCYDVLTVVLYNLSTSLHPTSPEVDARALRRAGRAAAAEFFHASLPPKFLATAGANRRRG